METKFTAGPWEAFNGYLVRKCEGDYCAPIAEVTAPYRKHVGIVRGELEQEANVRLIAASPELYHALRWAMRFIVRPSNADGQSLAEGYEAKYNAARAALAKAIGEAE